MTGRRAAGARSARVGVLAAVILLVAACGSATQAGSPPASPAPSASAAAATSAPTPPTESGSPAPSASAGPTPSPIPTFTRDPQLEALLPATIAGEKITPQSMRGTDILVSGRPEDIAALNTVLNGLGKSPEDYAFAYAIIGGSTLVGVFQIAGADPAKVRDLLIEQAKTSSKDVSVDSGTIGGKKVQVVRVPTGGTLSSGYFWPHGDVLWYVQTGDPTIAEKVLAEL